MGTFREALYADHVEPHEPIPPLRRRLQHVAGCPDDLALLRRRHGRQRSAESATRSLAHLDDGQERAVEA